MCRKCAPSSRIHMKYGLYDITTWLFVVSGDHSWSCFTDSEQKANSEISKMFIQVFTPKMAKFQWLFSKFDIYEKTGPSLLSCKPTPVLFVCRGIERTTRLNSFPHALLQSEGLFCCRGAEVPSCAAFWPVGRSPVCFSHLLTNQWISQDDVEP